MDSIDWWKDVRKEQLPEWARRLQEEHRALLNRARSPKSRDVVDIDDGFGAENPDSLRSGRSNASPERRTPNRVTRDESGDGSVIAEARELYEKFLNQMFSGETEYQTQIVALLAVFQHDIPSNLVADVVGCSTGYARRFEYRPDTGVREKTWSQKQGESRVGPKLRQRVLTRDNSECVRCGSVDELVVHHILPARRGGPPLMSNLATLCGPCHETAHDGVINSGRVFYNSVEDFWDWVETQSS